VEVLAFIYGLVIGVSLGLTGGGGSIFAVPLLVYGLRISPRTAVTLSLAAVGLTAGFGAALRIKERDIDVIPGFVFAFGGMLFAPLGAWVAHRVPDSALLILFAMLMGVVGVKMWAGGSGHKPKTPQAVPAPNVISPVSFYARLIGSGAGVGVLSGLFGIGGGFLVVPALLHVTKTTIHRAVATSLMVIFLVSISGFVAHLSNGGNFPMLASALFIAGGFVGMLGGSAWRCRLSAEWLCKIFAVAMWIVGAMILFEEGVRGG